VWMFRPVYVPYYIPKPPLDPPLGVAFVYFADTAAVGSDAAFGLPYGSDVPAGGESAWWSATIILADAGSGSDGALLWPADSDIGVDPGPLGGGGGGDPTAFLWNKNNDFLVLPYDGSPTAGAEGALEGAGTADGGSGNDGGLADGFGGDSATEFDSGFLETLTNAAVASADSGAGLEGFLLSWLGADVPPVIDAAAGFAADGDSGSGDGPQLGELLGDDSAAGSDDPSLITLVGTVVASADSGIGIDASFLVSFGGEAGAGDGPHLVVPLDGDSATELDSGFLETLTNATVASADSGTGADTGLLSQLGTDGGTGADPGGGGFNAVYTTSTIYLADSASAGDSGWLTELLGADSGVVPFEAAGVGLTLNFGYYIYSNTGIADPINYNTPIETIFGFSTTTWTTSALAYPGIWRFGVRAFNDAGIEENLDAAVTIVLDASGADITNRPKAPTALRALPRAGGTIRVEWAYNTISPSPVPTGFHVYKGTTGSPDYGTIAATVSFQAAIAGSFMADLPGLTDGTVYTIGVRAYNATAEEPNTVTVNCTADATGPAAVVSLSAAAI
jgi:hypothetical protein